MALSKITADSLGANAVTANAISNTAIIAAVGYTPANKAGDTFTGNVVFSANATVTGAAAFSNNVTKKVFSKLVYEWSFDIDDNLPRFWSIIEKQKNQYSDLKDVGNTAKFKTRDYNTWQKSWFPACTNVFAFNQ
jgi:hypothetical protein